MHNDIIKTATAYIDQSKLPHTFKKTVWEDNRWKEHTFYRVSESGAGISNWCNTHYGSAKYGITWWATFNDVAMSEKIYLHWMLCK